MSSEKTKKAKEPTVRIVKLSDKTRMHVNAFLTDDGTIMINMRKFYQNGSGDWKPSAQGITFPQEKALKIRARIKETDVGAETEAVKLPPKEKK